MAISKLLEKVLEGINHVELQSPNDVLSIARSITPIRKNPIDERHPQRE